MAVVDVLMSVYDLYLLSDRVELTEHEQAGGYPQTVEDIYTLDFVALRIGVDTWNVYKARKPVPNVLHRHHALIQPPVRDWDYF